jgi:hypothetical protein
MTRSPCRMRMPQKRGERRANCAGCSAAAHLRLHLSSGHGIFMIGEFNPFTCSRAGRQPGLPDGRRRRQQPHGRRRRAALLPRCCGRRRGQCSLQSLRLLLIHGGHTSAEAVMRALPPCAANCCFSSACTLHSYRWICEDQAAPLLLSPCVQDDPVFRDASDALDALRLNPHILPPGTKPGAAC